LQQKRHLTLMRSSVGSLSRVALARRDVSTTLNSEQLKHSVAQVVKPTSIASGVRKVGAVLVASPDPITDIPAMALLASSVVLKRREPANLARLAQETRRVVRDIQSLRL